MKLLNLGCGQIYHSEWVNVDVAASRKNVVCHDILSGIPFQNDRFDAVYHSHLLEHLSPEDARSFLQECHRVVKPGGVLRVAVPDLEQIVTAYQVALNSAVDGDEGMEQQYDWMMLELYDQAVRNSTGGRMACCLDEADDNTRLIINNRIGMDAVEYWKAQGCQVGNKWSELFRQAPSFYLRKVRSILAKAAVAFFMGAEGRAAFEEGVFRRSGEIHKWMYDRFSLKRLLLSTGFSDVQICVASQSRIPEFDRYNLETVDGRIRKPDSLFMEGVKL